MSRPRIAMVLNTMGFGGVPEVAYQLMRHLPRDRYDLRLCVMKGEAVPDSGCAERQQRFEALGIPVSYAVRSAAKMEMIAAVAAWLEAERIALLHTHSYRPNAYGRLAGSMLRPAGLKTIAHYHNQYDDKWDSEPAMLTLERQLARGTEAMIAVSRSVSSSVAERIGVPQERIDVVPNGVETGAFGNGNRTAARSAMGIGQSSFAFGLVGRICEQKGQEDFVAAAIALARRRRDAVFLMLGNREDKALEDRLRQSIADAGLAARIRFTGHVDDIAGAYAGLDCLVAPSRWEGFGLMLVEAMAAGVPIIASDTGAIPEVTGGDAALLVAPRDPPALTGAMERLAGDAALRQQLAAAGKTRASAFTWEAAAVRVAAIYERVLGGATDSRCA